MRWKATPGGWSMAAVRSLAQGMVAVRMTAGARSRGRPAKVVVPPVWAWPTRMPATWGWACSRPARSSALFSPMESARGWCRRTGGWGKGSRAGAVEGSSSREWWSHTRGWGAGWRRPWTGTGEANTGSEDGGAACRARGGGGDGGVAHQDGGPGYIVYLVERCGGGFLVQKVLSKGCTVVVVSRAGQYGKGQVEQEGGFAVLLGGVVVGDVAGDQECVGAL